MVPDRGVGEQGAEVVGLGDVDWVLGPPGISPQGKESCLVGVPWKMAFDVEDCALGLWMS